MIDFTTDLQARLDDLGANDYYSEALVGDGIEHVTTERLDQRRWYTVELDIYRRTADGALAGIRWNDPATEMQEDMDANAEVVPVEAFTTVAYRPITRQGA